MKKIFKRSLPFLIVLLLCFLSQSFTDGATAARRKVIPGGNTIGLKLYTDGLLVVGKADILSGGGKVCPGGDAGIEKGDRIIKINGIPIDDTDEFCKKIQNSCGDAVTLLICRGEKNFEKTVRPVFYEGTREYKIGLWVRDSAAGIGTVTFILSDGTFGALGHGISDIDTKKLIALKEGEVLGSTINSVLKGEAGTPGDLKGSFTSSLSGTVLKNTNCGIYGVLSDIKTNEHPVEIAHKSEIKAGAAQIISNVDGNKKEKFDVEIETVFPFMSGGKNMVIKITDKKLLEKTGGIVQGMSGSPLIQNGKLIGAVTHVFVNDPTRGYGIFIENMLDEAEKIK